MSGRGIRAFASGAKITIRRSIIRDNAFRGVSLSGALAVTMDGVQVLNSALGVVAGPGLDMTLSNSVVAGGNDVGNAGVAIQAQAGATATVNLAIESTVIRSSDLGVAATSDGGSTLVTISRSSISQNGTCAGRAVGRRRRRRAQWQHGQPQRGAGVDTTGGGVVQTLQNNVFQFNNVNVSGALTPISPL